MTTYKFNVDMTCGGCSKAVTAILSKLEGVSDINADLTTKVVTCNSTKFNADELLVSIQKTGKKSSIKND
ncbi:copper transport protein [Cavenderia fasciculata]|uniref:Copper transport protein n=1 Tax=Cavenderia fasciculata TaxID=261658 RepID=F4PMH3_CACFS|nr:copper transport protein [Cavenderia fasciculata]EGG23620.1 copper transport protein [Cavenderia fasciculata]|eukprot:XP_004361471.1 copper transport protein [Cavenderia fasciculata]